MSQLSKLHSRIKTNLYQNNTIMNELIYKEPKFYFKKSISLLLSIVQNFNSYPVKKVDILTLQLIYIPN